MKRNVLRLFVYLAVLPFLQAYGQCTLSPPLDLGPDFSICPGNSAILDAGSAYTSYVWSNGGQVQAILVNTPGLYWVRVVDTAGCPGSDTVIVSSYPTPPINLGPDINLCEGDTAKLEATIGSYAYLWNDGSTDQDLVVTVSGTYWCRIRNANNCTSTDTIQVTFHPYPQREDLGPDQQFCPGDAVTLTAPSGYSEYSWSNGATGQSISVDLAGTYTVDISNGFGCATRSFPVSVSEYPVPDAPVITAEQYTLTASGTGTFSWYFNGTLIAGATGNTHVASEPGIYTAQVTNAEGCTSAVSADFIVVFVIVKEDIPEIFTPNGDGINDFFFIENLDGFPNSKLSIMNRWGNAVYEENGYTGNWNGVSKNGEELPAGTYYYLLDLGNGNDPINGFIQITR